MTRQKYALTYPQLILQAIQKNYDALSLSRLRRAHEVTLRLMDGFYRAQDAPFLCHVTRTASIALEHGASPDAVSASLLHAVYNFGIFRDGKSGLTEAHQKEVQDEVGQEVDGLVVDYMKLKFHETDFLKAKLENYTSLSDTERKVLLIALANELEDFLDLQMVFRRDGPYKEMIEKNGALMMKLAKALGHSALAGELGAAFEESLSKPLLDAVKCGRVGAYELAEHYRMRRGRLRIFLSGIKQHILRTGMKKP